MHIPKIMTALGLGLFGLATATAATAYESGNRESRIRCRTMESTATRLSPRRICHTQAEWAEIERLRRQQLDAEGQSFRPERVDSTPPSVTPPS